MLYITFGEAWIQVAVVAFGMSNSALLTARSSTSETVGVSATDMTGDTPALNGTKHKQVKHFSMSILNWSTLWGGLCFLLYTSGQEDKLPCMQR